MEDFQNGQYANSQAGNSLHRPAPVQVPSALLPTVLQQLGLENASGPPVLPSDQDLSSPHWQRRAAALHTLARLGIQAPLPLLLAALDDEDGSVRAAAIRALAERVPLERLLTALHDPDWHVRETAIFTLNKLPQAVPPELLASALRDSDSSVREAAQLVQRSLQSANSSRRKPTSHIITFDQLPSTKADSGQPMMSIQLPGKQQPLGGKLSNMLKKDRGQMMQEQEYEQINGQEREYAYYEGYRDDNRRWEKVTSYTPPKKPFLSSGRGIGITSSLLLLLVVGAILGWTALVRPTLPISRIVEAQPTSIANFPTAVATPVSATGTLIYTYTGHQNAAYDKSVYDVQWTPDSSRIASVGGDGTVHVWDATTGGHVLIHRESTPYVTTVAWSPDGTRIASAAVDDTAIEIWDATTGRVEATYQLQSATASISHIGALDRLSGGCNTGVYALAWSPNGKELVAGGGYQTNGLVQVFDVSTGSRLLTYTAHSSCVDTLSWSPKGQYIVSGSMDGAINVWDPYSGKTAFRYTTAMPNDSVKSLAWSPDGTRIALATARTNLDIWDPFHGQNIAFNSSEVADWGVFQVAWSPDGQRIVTAGADKMVRIWDVTTQRLLYTYTGHTDEVFAVAWSPNGKMLASGSLDGTVQVWRA